MQLYFGGVSGEELVNNHELTKNDLLAYTPLDSQIEKDKNIEVHYLGYYVKWDPQECYYFSVDKIGFEANPVRTEGTYSKYNSLDDKIDGYFYYTSWIKFGMGRAMQDSAQEIRNKKITTDEGKALIKKFDGEFPHRYYKEFLNIKEKTIKKVKDKFSNPFLFEKGAWGQSIKHAHMHIIPLEGKNYKISSIIEEVIKPSGFKYEEINFNKIKKIYLKRKGYVIIEEDDKLNICYVTVPCNTNDLKKLCYRELFSKNGVGIKNWKTMNDSEKKLDKINKKITKEKLKE